MNEGGRKREGGKELGEEGNLVANLSLSETSGKQILVLWK